MNRLLTIVDSKYQRLEYLESTGTQWIDTGIKANQDTTLILDFEFETRTGLFVFCGEYNYSPIQNSFGFLKNSSAGLNRFDAFYGTQNYGTSSFDYTIKHIAKIDKTKVYIDDVLVKTFDTETSFETLRNLFLFAGYINSAFYKTPMKIRSCQIKQNGISVRNFVPVLRKTDNELGMLDLVEGKFYTNAGTGNFTANLDTMYAIIQGSPTQSPYGVFSGFSSSNYLDLQQPIVYNNNFEIFFKITTGTIGTNQAIFDWSGSNIGLTLIIYPSSGKLFMSAGNGQSWIIDKIGTTSLSPNTTYYIKFSYKNNVYKLELSTDNTNWNTEISVESSSLIKSTSASKSIGFSTRFNSRAFTGSIDLNNSYIKIGSTKYKLQAVVGYTVVGSPTITDGVVSGFSSANYLTLPSIPANSYNRIEIRTKITTGATIQAGNIIGDNTYYCNGLLINSDGKIVSQFNFSNYDRTRSDVIVEANTKYTIKTIVDVNAKSLMLNVNGTINTHTLQYYTDIKEIPYRFGYGYRNGTFNGSINVGETEIYIDNKLWFNGQQA